MNTDLNDRMNQKSEELRQKEQDEIASREDRLLTAATVTRGALFDTYEAVKLDDAASVNGAVSRFEQCTALLTGQVSAASASPAPAAAPTQSASALPFDFESLPADTQQIMIMIAQEPRRFKEETIGEKVVLKDTHYASARAAIRRQQEAERAQDEASDGSSSAPAPAAPAKKAAAAKKAAPAPPRSEARATEVQPPTPVQPPTRAQAPAPRPAPAPDADAAAPTPSGDEAPESPSQPQAGAMDKLKGLGLKLIERNPQQ